MRTLAMSEDWDEYFYLDPSAPSGLVWKISARRTVAGKPAGSLLDEGRYSVMIRPRGKSIRRYCHRIVYEMHHRVDVTGQVIDHFDRNPTNNLVGNLRAVTQGLNCKNKGMDTRNKSGFNGVHYAVICGVPYYIAAWVDGKRRFKHFPINKLGDRAKVMAIAYREEMIADLNRRGAGYTENHGTLIGDTI